jgi:hypothetical protein
VPGSEMFVVPLLLDERSAIGGEVDHDNAMILRAASAAGVEALEIFGLRREDGSNTKGQSADEAMSDSHRRMLSEPPADIEEGDAKA